MEIGIRAYKFIFLINWISSFRVIRGFWRITHFFFAKYPFNLFLIFKYFLKLLY
jgi:hypothetical protein